MSSEHGNEPRFLTRREVAVLARVTYETVERWDQRGILPRVRPEGTRRVLYPRDAVIAWLGYSSRDGGGEP
jgi:excisionase family DNA binding protein